MLTIDFNGEPLNIGDKVISYDFHFVDDSFFIGIIEDFKKIDECPCGMKHFVIRATHQIANGKVRQSFTEKERFMIYPPANAPNYNKDTDGLWNSKVVKVEREGQYFYYNEKNKKVGL